MASRIALVNFSARFLRRGTKSSIPHIWRNFSTAQQPPPEREVKNVEIPVPWGKLAGKLWGPSSAEPILALHGWHENAGSFDPLMRDFPSDLSVLAIDFPGHGYSSWLPKGIAYTPYVYMQTIATVKQYFGMSKIGMIAHSLASMYAFNYSSLFPENVKFMVTLDDFKYPSYTKELYLSLFFNPWNPLSEGEQLNASAPRYQEQEAIDRYIKARENSIDEDMCRTLFVRGVTRHSDGTVTFNRDPRVDIILMEYGFSHQHLRDLAARIRCPYAILKSENSEYRGEKELFFDVMEVLKESVPECRFHTVPGTHHFHMKNTKAVVELTEPFIRKYS